MSKNISEIDKNFAVPPSTGEGLTYLSADEAPFRVYGLIREDGGYARMPRAVAEKVNQGTVDLHRNTSGGRVRFATDSQRIAVKVDMPFSLPMPHMPQTGSGGFDLYRDGVFFRTFIPPMSADVPYAVEVPTPGEGVHEYEINFPLYHDVNRLMIGLESGARLGPGRAYENYDPVVYYGSSITQGGCASRPGMNYTNIISRCLNCDFVNLGFSGNARGELAMADYIAGLPMSVFVCDYDHNAPTLEHLQRTHWLFAQRVRAARPDLPIVFITRPDIRFPFPDNVPQLAETVRATWRRLRDGGDEKVWFIDGAALWDGPEWHGCTVDGRHPNDLGFFRMAEVVRPVLEEALRASRA